MNLLERLILLNIFTINIRTDPSRKKRVVKKDTGKQNRWYKCKLTLAERKNRMSQNKNSYVKKLQA